MGEAITIGSLAKELKIKPKAVKELLELAGNTANTTELTDEQVQAVIKNAPAPTVEDVVYTWPRMKRASFNIGRKAKDGTVLPTIKRAAQNGVLRLNPADPEDALVIAHLEKHRDNQANGGTRFARLNAVIADGGTDAGARINDLMALPARTLTQLAADELDGDLVAAQTMSRGDQIALVLGMSDD